MRDKFFVWLARTVYNRYLLVFSICILLTVMFGYFAGKIRMEMTWGSLIPDGEPAKETFDNVINDFGSATQIVIAIEGPNKERLINAAEELAPKLKNLTVEIPESEGSDKTKIIHTAKTVQTHYDTSFIAQHGLMLVKAKDLRNQGKLYTDYNLVPFLTHTNDVLETEYVQNSDNLTKQENEAVRSLDGMYDFVESLGTAAKTSDADPKNIRLAVDAMTIGDGYVLSNDKKMLLIFLTPTINLNAPMDVMVTVVNAIDNVLLDYEAQNPDLNIGMTGGHVISRDELEAGMEDTIRNVTVAFVIILLVFMISFRMITGPFLAMIVLMAGITWDIGIAYLFLGRLNLFTAMCSVVLLGLGVDFAIHILSAYTEFRHKGYDVEQALYKAFMHIGTGLITGAVTTATAFLALVLTSYSAFREFGFVVGVGIIACLAASLFFLTSTIVIKEKLWSKFRKNSEPKRVDMEFKFLGAISGALTKRPWVTVAAAVVITAVSAYYIKDVYMNRNYMDMEPEGLESVWLQREIPRRFNMSPDNMFVIVDDLEEANRLTDILNERPAIGFVESLTDFLPSPEKQAGRIPEVQKIFNFQKSLPRLKPVEKEELIEQLYRFSDNLTEMSSLAFIGGMDKMFDKTNLFLGLDEEGEQVGENRVLNVINEIENKPNSTTALYDYQRKFKPLMQARISNMANAENITLDMVPQDIKDRFISNNGDQYMISIYSKTDIWDGLFTTPFINTVLEDVPEATGMPVLMKVMIQKAKDEGAKAMLYTFIAFFIILLIDFRSLKTALIATIPLVSAFVLLLGIMGIFGFPFSLVNVIGLPLILGIGIDDGVHIIHRYRIEGKNKLDYTMSSIGKAILLTSLTTMLGFGSLIPSAYRGYASLGILVTLGIGLCFVTSVIILPAIMKIAWGGKKEHAGFFRNE